MVSEARVEAPQYSPGSGFGDSFYVSRFMRDSRSSDMSPAPTAVGAPVSQQVGFPALAGPAFHVGNARRPLIQSNLNGHETLVQRCPER